MGEWATSIVRVLFVVLAALAYVFITGTEGTVRWLAFSTLIVAGAYSLYLFLEEPYPGGDLGVGRFLVSVADLGLVLAWLYATDPLVYRPFLYASVIALSFRYDLGRTLIGSGAHVAGYVAVLFAAGRLAPNLADTAIRGGLIVLLGTLGTLLSMVASRETVAKEAYQDLVEDLERSLSLHEATLDATRDGILVVDREGNIVSYNDRFQEMWSLPDEVVATRDDERALEFVLDQLEDERAFLDRVAELYDNPTEESLDEIVLEDGRVFERFSRPQTLGDEVVGRVWSFHDVTEEREMQDELARSNEELRRFTSAVSHDLREPLRMITSYLDLLAMRSEGELDDQHREYLMHARDGARRLSRMIQGLLRYSRVEQAQQSFETVDLNEPVRDAEENLRSLIEREGAHVDVDDLPTVRGDRAQLATLFQNLLSNAIRYNEGVPHVWIEGEETADGCVAHVSDDGIGIAPKEQELIFEMFQQGSTAGREAGEGIGLTMCQKIVERHGGDIRVDSTPGEGTTFSVTLPPARDPSPTENGPHPDRARA